MSEPSAACTSIEVSGPMNRSRPSAYERNRTPSSAMEIDHRLPTVAPALDLLGHRAVAHREHLVAARVGDDRPLPAHELVEAAHLGDQLVAGLDEQVERVAEHHVVAELGDLAGVQRLHRGGRGERHERRRADRAVRGLNDARSRGAVASGYLKRGTLDRLAPVISPGCSSPSSARIVGATSASVPSSRSSPTSAVTISGTGFFEWAVFGLPSGSSIWSALPWSAVITQHAAALLHRLHDLAETRVHGLHGLHGRLDHAGVADHVGVREVDDPEGEVAPAPALRERAGGLAGAHLGLLVVGRHVARRVHELAFLARVLVLLAAVEEVGHVRVLLGLGHVELRLAAVGERRGERHVAGAPAGTRSGSPSPRCIP